MPSCFFTIFASLHEKIFFSREAAKNAKKVFQKSGSYKGNQLTVIENIEKFIDELSKSLRFGTFVKMTLGNYKGADEHLQKLSARLIDTKKGMRLLFQFRYDSRDMVKNHDLDEAVNLIRKQLQSGFRSGHLFTIENDLQLTIGKNNPRLKSGKPTFTTKPSLAHDREKKVLVDPNSFYLKTLGITTDDGKIRDKQRDKWKQINKFVEILGGLFEKSSLRDKKSLSIVDMGSGKGYLTFAAYDYFARKLGTRTSMSAPAGNPPPCKSFRITGVESRRELVEFCNQTATAGGFDGLKFVHGTIADHDPPGDVDILIALHACDTATDDALYKGILANAEIIIAAPCCHKEIRPQIKHPKMLAGILKHGIMLERTAETITDGLRSLLLERSGYATKIFEFVPTEHTPKNNMLVGTRLAKPKDASKLDADIRALIDFYGIREQRLERLLI